MGGRGPFLQTWQASFQEGDSCVLGVGRLVVQHGCGRWGSEPPALCFPASTCSHPPCLTIAAGLQPFPSLPGTAKARTSLFSPLPFNPYAVIPSLNIAAGLLGFFLLKSLAKGLDWAKAPIKFNPPLTAQEVTVIQVRMGAFVCLFTWPVSDSTGQQGTCNTPPQLRRRVKPRAGMLL